MANAKFAGTRLKDALPPDAIKIGTVGPYDKYQRGAWLYLLDRRTGKVINVAKDKR